MTQGWKGLQITNTQLLTKMTAGLHRRVRPREVRPRDRRPQHRLQARPRNHEALRGNREVCPGRYKFYKTFFVRYLRIF
jgi:hypothetical protein